MGAVATLTRAGPDMSVAAAQKVVDEALANLDEVRVGLTEMMGDIRDEGGAYQAHLTRAVAPYVSGATLRRLVAAPRPS